MQQPKHAPRPASVVCNGQTRAIGAKVSLDEAASFDKLARGQSVSNARLVRALIVAAGRRPDLAAELIATTGADNLPGLGAT